MKAMAKMAKLGGIETLAKSESQPKCSGDESNGEMAAGGSWQINRRMKIMALAAA